MRRIALVLNAVVLALLVTGTATIGHAQTAGDGKPQAVPMPGYTVGPEDVLGVLFWREPDISGDVIVRPDGMITLPLIGDMKAAGLAPEALRDQIQEAAGKYLTDVNVTVVPRQINSRKVYITGEVATPGPYALTGPRTVMQLIALAGGLSEYAETEQISIIRAGQPQAFKFNYKEVSKGKNLAQNIALQPGDTVVVP